MFYGRNEEAGLRCVYHGLKFDVDGNCVDAPCVPQVGDKQLQKIREQLAIKAYPCIERGDVVWTYMGPPEHKPAFPDLEWTMVPTSHRFATRHIQECNWLQGSGRRIRCDASDVPARRRRREQPPDRGDGL